MSLITLSSPSRRRLLRSIQVLATLLLLALILRDSSYEQFLGLRDSVEPAHLVATVCLSLLATAVGAVALLLLFEVHNRLDWWGVFIADYFYVQAICLVTPAQMGEASLPYVGGRGRFAPGEIAAALVIQRIVALATLVAFAIWGAGSWVSSAYLWAATLFILVACFVLVLLISNHRIRESVSQFIGKRFGPILHGFYVSWTAMLQQRRGRLLAHIASMQVRYLLAVASTYMLLAGFDIYVPFADLAALAALASLAALLPVTINGVGVTEGVFVLALSSFGYAAAPVIAACLAGRLINALVMVVVAAAYTAFRPK